MRASVLTIMDKIFDFGEGRAKAEVRELSVKLMQECGVVDDAIILNWVSTILKNSKLDWIVHYNALLIVKQLSSHLDLSLAYTIIFSNLLKCFSSKEDDLKMLSCELLETFLPLFTQSPQSLTQVLTLIETGFD